MTTETLTSLLDQRSGAEGSRVVYRQKRYGIWHEATWSDVKQHVDAYARGLRAAGIGPGARFAIVADPSREAALMILAALRAGATPVVLFPTLPAAEVRGSYEEAGCKGAYCDTIDRADKILPPTVPSSASTCVFVLDERDAEDRADWGVSGIETLRASGSAGTDLPAVTEPAPIVTQSGATGGAARLVQLDQGVLVAAAKAFAERFGVSRNDRSIAILPLGHPVELSLSLVLPLLTGMLAAFSESARTMQADMIETGPTIVVGPPRLWQKLRADTLLEIQATGRMRRAIFRKIMGGEDGVSQLDAQAPGTFARLVLCDALRARLGLSKVRTAVSTGGQPVAAVNGFFQRIGISVIDAYAVTACAGIAATAETGANGGKTTGKALTPLSGFGIRVGQNGAVEASSAGGDWIDTGDTGHEIAGIVQLDGRREEQLATGFTASVETAIKADPLIREAVAARDPANGDVVAIVQADPGMLGAWANRHQLQFTNFANLVSLPEVREVLHRSISAAIETLDPASRPGRYVLLDHPLGVESGELTPLFAARRRSLEERLPALTGNSVQL